MPSLTEPIKYIGNKDAAILILIDHPDTKGFKQGKVLDGPALSAFQNCLHQADLITNEVYLVPLVADDPNFKRWWIGGNSKRPARDVSQLYNIVKGLLSTTRANIILPMGDLSHYILTGRNSLAKDRGYIFHCNIEGFENVKVLPVQDIKQMVWANYIWRFYLASDFMKAKANSINKFFKYEERSPQILYSVSSIKGIIAKIEEYCLVYNKPVSIDIEVANYQVSHVGLAVKETISYSIPFRNDLWTLEEEVQIWIAIAKLMSNSEVKKVGQNFIFDIHFLLQQNHIVTNGKILDTMMSQSILFPDFLKGLGFLASTYLNVPTWKGMVKFKNIKEES